MTSSKGASDERAQNAKIAESIEGAKQQIADLLGKATSRVRILSGTLTADIFLQDPVFKAMRGAIEQQRVGIEILLGEPSVTPGSQQWRQRAQSGAYKTFEGWVSAGGVNLRQSTQRLSPHFIIVDESLARIEAPHLLRDPSDGFQMRSAEISTEPEFVLRWAQAFNRDFGHGKPVALDPVLGPTVKPTTGLEDARTATKPLQRRYGITVAVIAALIVVVALAPLPTPIVTGVGSALLLATVCAAFRWHVEVSRVLKTVRRRTSGSVD